jgi:hypothetical protein
MGYTAQGTKQWKIIPTGDQTTTVATATDITGLSLAVAANSVYHITGSIHHGCNNTGGLKYTTTFPSGATQFIGAMGSTTSNAAFIFNSMTASGTLTTTAFGQENNANRMATFNGTLTVGATAGTFQFAFASGTGTQTSTIYQEGSVLTITKIA